MLYENHYVKQQFVSNNILNFQRWTINSIVLTGFWTLYPPFLPSKTLSTEKPVNVLRNKTVRIWRVWYLTLCSNLAMIKKCRKILKVASYVQQLNIVRYILILGQKIDSHLFTIKYVFNVRIWYDLFVFSKSNHHIRFPYDIGFSDMYLFVNRLLGKFWICTITTQTQWIIFFIYESNPGEMVSVLTHNVYRRMWQRTWFQRK